MSVSKWSSWKLGLAIGLPLAAAASVGAAAYYMNKRRRPAERPSSGEQGLIEGVVVRDYPNCFREPAQVVSQVTSPRYVAISRDGDIFVTCSREQCVFVYDSSGQRKATIGSPGTGELQFKNPSGIAISEDVVYVVENGNHRVQKFTTGGKFLGFFGCFGSSDGELNQPMGICISHGGDIYVSDCGNDRVQVFHSDGSFSHGFGGEGPVKTVFTSPFGMAFSPDGDLHVAMYATDSVMVFSSAGEFVRSYGVKNPAGLAIDKAGFSLVSSLCNEGLLLVFDSSGNLVHTVEGFDYPCGVALAEDDSVWVADRNNHRLLKY